MVTKKRIPSMFVYSPNNRKTGRCLSQYVGETRADSLESCKGCPYLDGKCYSQNGSVGWSHTSMIKANDRGSQDYSFGGGLKRAGQARFIRMGAIGDPSATPVRELKQIKSHPLPVIGYTHFWETRGSHLKDLCLASCGSIEEADRAIANGWRATVVVPKDYNKPVAFSPDGNRIVFCPNALNKKIQCEDCMICEAGNKFQKSAPIVALRDISKGGIDNG